MKFFLISFLLLYSIHTKAKDVSMKWKAIKGAKSYMLQVSKEEDFASLILEKKVANPTLTHNLKSGIYYLRVQAVDGFENAGKWSKPFKLVVTAPIQPADIKSEPEKISYKEKPPEVKTTWESSEKAHTYLVKLIKDGKEIESKKTSTPQTDFNTPEPGNYDVQVSAGYDKYFGPPVVVKKFKVQKEDIPATESFQSAQIPIKSAEKFSSQKSVQLEAKNSPNAKFYDVVLRQVNDREPANENSVFIKMRVTNPKIELGKLPPGRYVASITPSDESQIVGPVSEYTFDVQKTKPVEFEKIDLSFKYNLKTIQYYDNIVEAGQSNTTNSLGGEFVFEGNMWFSESHFGVKARGNWGNMLIENNLVSTNELLLAAMYRYSFWLGKYKNDIKINAGIRTWSMPIILNVRPPNSTTTNFQILTPTLVGPLLGFDYQVPVSAKLAFNLGSAISLPVTKSSISSDGLQSTLLPTLNYRADVGAKYALKNNMRLIASAGYQSDRFSYLATQGNNGSSPAQGSQTQTTINGAVLGAGVEMTDEGSEFTSTRKVQREKFSDLDLTARYSLTPVTYSAHLQENTFNKGNANGPASGIPDPNFSSATSGNLELETTGYFINSHHGLRLSAAWGGYTYQNTTISYPEFMAQWGYRSHMSKSQEKWQFKNYFGIRTWQVPIVAIQTNNFFSQNPQLYGPAETAQVLFRLGETWGLRAMGEISAPVLVTNKDSVVSRIISSYMSYKLESSIIKKFSEDFSGGLALGFKNDSLRYVSEDSSDATSSTAQISTPTFTLFGTYSF